MAEDKDIAPTETGTSPTPLVGSTPHKDLHSYELKGLVTENGLLHETDQIDTEHSSRSSLKLFIDYGFQQNEAIGSPSLKLPKIKTPVPSPQTPAGQQATDGETDIHDSPNALHSEAMLYHIKTPEFDSITFSNPNHGCLQSADIGAEAKDVNAAYISSRHSATESDIHEMLMNVNFSEVGGEEDKMIVDDVGVELSGANNDVPMDCVGVTDMQSDLLSTGSHLSTEGNRLICHPTEDLHESFGLQPQGDIVEQYDIQSSTHIHDSFKESENFLRGDDQLSTPEQVREEGETPEAVFLGKGAYGDVWKYWEDECTPLVVKNMQCYNAEREEVAMNEIRILEELDHDNVVKFVYMYEDPMPDGTKHINIVLECMDGGSLENHLCKKGGLEEQELIALMKPILKGVSYIHSKNVVHRDIKPDNLLMDSTYEIVKVADFGTSVMMSSPDAAISETNWVGTSRYCAPEVCRCDPHGLPADVWSLGASMIRMINGEQPYQELYSNDLAIIFKVGTTGLRPAITRHVSDELMEVIDRCMKYDPQDRITVNELLQLPIFQD